MTRKLRGLELEFLRFLPIWSLSCNPVTDWPGRHTGSELASLGRCSEPRGPESHYQCPGGPQCCHAALSG